MRVRPGQPSATSRWLAVPIALRVLGIAILAACTLSVPADADARPRRKAAAHTAAKKAARTHKVPKAALPAAASPVASPAAPPPAVAPPAPPAAARLPGAATPVTAVALARAATPSTAHAPAAAAAKPASAHPAPAVALPAAATAAAVGVPAHAFATASPAHGLPAAASPTTAAAPAKPHAAAGPVATAWALPPVPAEKLRSDVKFDSIARLVQAGKFSEALAEVDALLEKSPNDDELQVQRARLLYWLDRRESARAALAPVQERHPEDPEIRELDAQLKLADGDVAGALAQYRALEIAGDGRPELHQRIIDLALELDEDVVVTKSLRFGGHLSDEQEMAYTRLIHPWFSDVAGTWTLHSAVSWWRADAHLGRRLSKRWSVLVGGIFEQRYSGADMQRAEALKGELYFGFWRIDGMLHVESSLNKTFLPDFDGRLDLALSIVKQFSLGLYGRYADYQTLPTSQVRPSQAWTLAPNVIFYVKDWTLQPGYMAMHIQGNQTTSESLFHTGFFKARWEPDPRWMAFAWVFVGTDPTFIERYGINTPLGISGVLGGEHWWTPRWGTRLSASRVQPFDAKNDPFTEVTLVLRGRL